MGKVNRTPDIAQGYLQTVHGKLWILNLKAIIGSVLLGVVLTILGALFERVDAALTGGAFTVFGAINFFTFTAVSTILFRLPGGIITGLTNALISMATAASPMSPWFIPINTLAPIIFALVIWRLSLDSIWPHILANTLTVWLANSIIIWGLVVTVKVPLNVAIVSWVVSSIAANIGAPIFSIIIMKSVNRARVLQ